MSKIYLYSFLLILGLIGSQYIGTDYDYWVKIGSMFCMSFIMIHVGYEFEIDKLKPKECFWDFLIAVTAATLPWVFCAIYFIYALDMESWKDALLLARFSSPTSAGILLSMLAAAGLATTWVFRKVRIIAIFDDIDAILMMIPIKMIAIGVSWELISIVFMLVFLLGLSWRFLHVLKLPVSWPWVMSYSVIITVIWELIYASSKLVEDVVPLSLEVLLPAFALGAMLARPQGHDPHIDDAREGHQEGPEEPKEQFVSTIVVSVFMVFAGLSMPIIPVATMDWRIFAFHVIFLTLLSNLGKMFPIFCYKDQASLRERLALCIGLFPRGEAATRKLVLSVGYGLGGLALTVSVWSITLNLLLTGVFILIIKKLIGNEKYKFT